MLEIDSRFLFDRYFFFLKYRQKKKKEQMNDLDSWRRNMMSANIKKNKNKLNEMLMEGMDMRTL